MGISSHARGLLELRVHLRDELAERRDGVMRRSGHHVHSLTVCPTTLRALATELGPRALALRPTQPTAFL